MALQQLTPDEVQTWSRAQKDAWWLKNVYRGDMPQLTWRSGLTGFLLGGVLAATALYVAAKTGVGIGVGLTSVIVSFALYRGLAAVGWGRDFTILENNCTQSIATAAGYMVLPFTTSVAAYMVVTGRIVPWYLLFAWATTVAILGVLLAFPLKRRFVNDEQLPFPEGRASGVVLDALYTGHAAAGMYRAKLLAVTAIVAGGYTLLVSDGWMRLLQLKLLMMDRWAGVKEAWTLHERLDTYYYDAHGAILRILGTDIRALGLRLTLDTSMLGIGGLMGIGVATSCVLGAFVNFAILAPIMIRHGDIVARVAADGSAIPISRAEIVNQWSLWWGVTMMVVGSLVGLLARPKLFTGAWAMLRGRRESAHGNGDEATTDVLRHIELPLGVSYVGVPIFAVLGAAIAHYGFNVPWILTFISLPLVFVLTVICTNSMALTSWTPIGALSKITQFTIGAIDRVNPASNLIPASMTGEVSANAANLLSDIKPGYMLGAKPRQQAIGHVIGIFSGALVSVPLYYLLFLPPDAQGVRSTATIITDHFPMPGALQWKGVADLIARGISSLPASAVVSMIVAAACAIALEAARIASRGRFPLNAVSLGLGVVLPPELTFDMWLGAFAFALLARRYPTAGTRGHETWVEGCEAISAGLISGTALVGIGNALINVLLPG